MLPDLDIKTAMQIKICSNTKFKIFYNKLQETEPYASQFTLKPEVAIVNLHNDYGSYNGLTNNFIITDLEESLYFSEFLLTEGLRLAKELYGYIDKVNFKVAMNNIYCLLNHLIPNDELLNIMRAKAQDKSKNSLLERIEGTFYESLDNSYIYAIYIKEELIYIGCTGRFILTRIQEHENEIDTGSAHVYQVIRSKTLNRQDIHYKILFESHNKMHRCDLENFERVLINLIKPCGNLSGNTQNYIYSDKSIEQFNKNNSDLYNIQQTICSLQEIEKRLKSCN